MPTCIYCLAAKPKDAFNREHVLPEAFGRFRGALTLANRHEYRLCTACNSELGKALDIGLARNSWEAALRLIRGMAAADPNKMKYDRVTLSLPANHRLAPLLLRFIRRPGFEGAFCSPIPQLRLTFGQLERHCIPEWRISQNLPALLTKGKPTSTEIFWWEGDPDAPKRIEEKARAAGLTQIEWKTIEEGRSSGPEQVDAHLEFTIDAVIARGIAKIAYEYFVWVANEREYEHLVNSDGLSTIRQFIMAGDNDWRPIVVPTNEAVLADETATMRRTQGHILALRWESNGIVVRVALFNEIVYRVLVCPPPSAIWHDVDTGHHFDLSRNEVRPLTSGRFIQSPYGVKPPSR